MLGNTLFSILARIRSKRIEFPLKGVKRVALRPSIFQGEILYSLPLVKALSSEYDLTVFLTENRGFKYFERFPIEIMEYPTTLSLLSVFLLRKRLKHLSFDLFIDLNRNWIDAFSFLLDFPITASIYEDTSVNLLVRSRSRSIIESYQSLMELLGLSVSWEKEVLGLKRWKKKDERVGISSDVGVFPGFLKVSRAEDLYEISSLITKKNTLSTIAFFLEIPQVLLLKEGDNFQPPPSMKVVRYAGLITAKVIESCLNTNNG